MPVKLCIAGAAGRMGKRLVTLAHEDPELAVAHALDYEGHPDAGADIGTLCGIGALGVPLAESFPPGGACDVIVEFTLPDATVEHARHGAEKGLPLVIGTTGLNGEQREVIRRCAEKVPVIHAPNFSVGVNVLFKAASLVAKSLGSGYEVEIVETHHDQKVDAPSGTALGLAGHVAEALGRDLEKHAVYGRHGHTGKRPKGEIGIHALRMADVVGEHTVYFAIGGERLELTHKASSRDTFARGALRAAKWLIQNKKCPGFYRMAQVLGLE